MTAQVIDFHTIPEANKRWADMERFHHLRSLGLMPVLPHQVEMPSDVDPFDLPFYAPPDDPA